MVGRYNVYNYLTAMLLIHELGYEIDAILALNTKLKAPKGRMELIVYGTNGIFVDYAHTPDATLNVLESAQEFKKEKLLRLLVVGEIVIRPNDQSWGKLPANIAIMSLLRMIIHEQKILKKSLMIF